MIHLSFKDHPWGSDPKVLSIMTALGLDKTRFVGGCVRNALLGYEVADIDIATQLEPQAVQTALNAANIKSIPTGIDHGTVTAVIDGQPFEITSLRKDVDTDGRRAVVSFTKDWAEDAQRRDFTMNALYADHEGRVYDPTGQGLSDLEANRFVFVGRADERVAEDYLRILRYFRFIAWYGEDAKLDSAALKACREGRSGLKKLSAERVWGEVKKLLAAPNPVRVLRTMLTNEVLETILPESSNVEGLQAFISLEQSHHLPIDVLLRLMAMSARNPLPMALLAKRLKMSNNERIRIRAWADDGTSFDPNAPEREKLAAIYNTGKRLAMDRCLIRAAGETDPILASKWVLLASEAEHWKTPTFPLTGKDLAAQGVKAGPGMGKKLDALKALWIRSGFTADKSKLLIALKLMGQ